MTPPPAELFATRVFLGPALRAQPDRRLVDLVRDGYDAAFEEIVRRYRRPLDRFAAGIVGGRSEDVTQDAFSKALLALRGSEAEIELRPWLYRIVRNTALNDLRDRAPIAEELSERLPGARSAAAEVEAREELRDLMERLQALPEPQRAALVMRELEGLSHEEIAAALGVSGGAARQAIYRARAALRDGFGLLVPLPLLRALAEYGADAGRAGGAIAAGAGASSAGGAALGGLGGSALKLGMATVLVAGTVGAGVAIKDHRGEESGPEAAAAAPLSSRKERASGPTETSGGSIASSGTGDRGHGSGGKGDSHGNGGPSGGRSASLGSAGNSGGGSKGGPGPSGSGGGSHSGEGSGHSGSDSHHAGSGGFGSGDDSSGSSGSGSGDRHGGRSSSDDGGASGGSSGGPGENGGTSGGPGGGDLVDTSGASNSGDGSGGSGETEAQPSGEPALSESDDGGGGDSGSGGGSSGSGSGGGDLGTSATSGGSDGGS